MPQRFIFAWVHDSTADDATWDARIAPFLAQAKVAPSADRPLLGLAINAVGAGRAPEVFQREMEFAKRHGLRVQMHYLEPAAEAPADRTKWPMLRDAGGAGANVSYAHFIHADAEILREAAAGGASMI